MDCPTINNQQSTINDNNESLTTTEQVKHETNPPNSNTKPALALALALAAGSKGKWDMNNAKRREKC
jgi:hypothetical protein